MQCKTERPKGLPARLFGHRLQKNILKGFVRAGLKIEKWTDFSQEMSSCKEKSAGILCVFRAFLTQQMPFLVEKDSRFDFSNSP